MTRLNISVRSACLLVVFSATTALAQGRIIDEGTFSISKSGAPSATESFRIVRGEGGLVTATGHFTSGAQQVTSSLTTDALGTPVQYELHVRDKGAETFGVKAVARGGRLTSMSSTRGGDESMREYPIVAGRSLILDQGLMHQLYFVALGKQPGALHAIEMRTSQRGTATLAAKGLEPIEIAGKSVTATHYELTRGAVRYDFWLDAQGRVLRVEADGLTATREELPK
jgi:hypothetical protein